MNHPAWPKLQQVLVDLATGCKAPFTFVVDEGNGLWCVGLGTSDSLRDAEKTADRFYREIIASRAAALRRGERLDVTKTDGDDRFVAMSFAGIYVAVVWYGSEPVQLMARPRLRQALPTIEALILSLPPAGGPTANAGAGKLRA